MCWTRFAVPSAFTESDVQITVSVGYVTAASGSMTVDELLRRADLAMYAAKRRGKARSEPFDPAVAAEFAETFESTAPVNEEAERTTWLARAEGQRTEIEEILQNPARAHPTGLSADRRPAKRAGRRL